jgi:hypothetical protein
MLRGVVNLRAVALAALVLAVAIASGAVSGCSSGDDAAVNAQGGSGGSDASGARWGEGDCYACVSAACSDVISQCGIDPTCAAWFTCIRDCPAAGDGNLDASCAAGCPQASGTAAQGAIEAVEHCRTEKGGAGCTQCGGVLADGGGDAGPSCHPLP